MLYGRGMVSQRSYAGERSAGVVCLLGEGWGKKVTWYWWYWRWLLWVALGVILLKGFDSLAGLSYDATNVLWAK